MSINSKVPHPILVALRNGLLQTFSIDDLMSLCFDLDLEYDDIAGQTRKIKIEKIIDLFSNKGNLVDLINYCIEQRPNYKWPDPFAREINTTVVEQNPERKKELGILFLTANPIDLEHINTGKELREIQEKIRLSKLRDNFCLIQKTAVRPSDISQALLDSNPWIVHFLGHGNEGELFFEDEIGHVQPVTHEALASLFEIVSGQVECVLLNACYSSTQAQEIANYVHYVIGMNQAITDQSAILFSVGFYQAIGAGKSIVDAYKFGCVQIRLHGIPEHLTPVLIQSKA